jgi:hypothetical protein
VSARGAWLLALLLAGCGGEPESLPEAPSGAAGRNVRGGRFGAAEPSAPVAEAAPPAPAPPPRVRGPGGVAARLRARDEAVEAPVPYSTRPPTEAPPPATVEAAPVARDLEAELRAAFVPPPSCLTYERATELGASLRLRVSVTLVPSGRVTRASVSAPGLATAETACLEEAAMAVALSAPIEGAPRTVSASIDFAIETRPAPTEE